jgi:AraC family transcriptional regulator, regulatory protein of adaptative response / methylated-DNA-[protein]-cysteine methyltransferase
MENVIQKARHYLDAHRGERVTLERLASAVGASPFHLQRRFKEAFGVSPRDYQDAQRVESVKSSRCSTPATARSRAFTRSSASA